MIQRIVIIFRELSQPIQLSTIVYFTCLLGYNIYGTYSDSKTYLDKFREGKLKQLEKYDNRVNNIKTDWDAVKCGANSCCFERLWYSIIWPITCITNIVPAIVITLNPPKKE